MQQPQADPASKARRAIPEQAQESLWHTSDGHAIRQINLGMADRIQQNNSTDHSRRARGAILFLPGRADNYEKYLETLHGWYLHGWQVTASDWRGQGGSGRLGKDSTTGHIDDYAIWIDDLAQLYTQWRSQTAGPHYIVAHSMGGHLVLRALIERRIDPQAVVLVSPMLGFTSNFLPLPIAHLFARLMMHIGDPHRPAWRWSEKPGVLPAGREALLTHDHDRYSDEQYWRETRPELVMGPGSWRWVERGISSMRAMFVSGALEQVHTPILILATAQDKLVSFSAIRQAVARLPDARLINFGSRSHHEILRESDPVRDQALAEIAAFLDDQHGRAV